MATFNTFSKKQITLKNHDLGGKHGFYDKYTNHKFKTITFSPDILEYLIRYGKFILNENNSRNPFFSLSINDNKLPILSSNPSNYEKNLVFIVNIKYKDIFETIHFFDSTFKLKDTGIYTLEEYYFALSRLTKIYQEIGIYDGIKIPIETIKEYDKTNGNYILIPCSTDYGFTRDNMSSVDFTKYPELKKIQEQLLKNPNILQNDFIYSNILSINKEIQEFVNKFYNKDFKTSGLETNYLLPDGTIKDSIIVKEMPHKIPKKKYLILGAHSTLFELCNKEFSISAANYNEFITEQAANIEDIIKEYTRQEIPSIGSNITLGDFIASKKKISAVDIDYIEKTGLLTQDEIKILKQKIKEELNLLCHNQFNKPNISLTYYWLIIEVDFHDDNFTLFAKCNICIHNIRQINDSHTDILKELLHLSRTEMLVKAGIINPGDSYNQVFTRIHFIDHLVFLSNYIHPLNYNIYHYSTENAIMTLEQLIQLSSLQCDGQFPGMEKYKGLPLCSVIPIEVTKHNHYLNSSFFFNNITCYPDNVEFFNSKLSRKTLYNNLQQSNQKILKKSVLNIKQTNNLFTPVLSKKKHTRKHKISLQYTQLYNIFNNNNIRVISSLNTPNGLVFVVLYNIDTQQFYYVLLEINILNTLKLIHDKIYSHTKDSFLLKCINTYISTSDNNNSNTSCINIYHAKDLPFINIILIKDFTPSDKVFSILGNECIYKQPYRMHSFFTKDKLDFTFYDGSMKHIKNPYNYMLVAIINMVNSLPENVKYFIKTKQDININRYYRVSTDNEHFFMVDDIEFNPLHLYTFGLPDIRNDTLVIDSHAPFPNNTVFITIGNKYIMMLNKFFADELQTEYIPKSKLQLKHHFKFTAWVLTREYAIECIKIFSITHNSNQSTGIFYKIPTHIQSNVLFHITSIKGSDNLKELLSHIEEHSNFIKNYIISKDPFLCKAYNPSIIVNPLSDLSSSILHFHFMQDIIHFNPLKTINFKHELLSYKSSIYDLFSSNSYSINKIINLLKTNNNAIYDSLINNPYLPSLKLSALLSGLYTH